MVEAIVGMKGSGKTPIMLEEIAVEAEVPSNNIIFIEYGRRLDRLITHKVRLIDITEYPVRGYDGLLAFLAGLNAKDYDITHIYIDSISSIVGNEDMDGLTRFIADVERLAAQVQVKVTLTISHEPESLPDAIQAYARK
ncbi:MAG TPA: hypothetical protein GXZ64_00130 [Clostridiaceae bacterium]|nr:hypothetical protein [Clostridiaceae bacterium]